MKRYLDRFHFMLYVLCMAQWFKGIDQFFFPTAEKIDFFLRSLSLSLSHQFRSERGSNSSIDL